MPPAGMPPFHPYPSLLQPTTAALGSPPAAFPFHRPLLRPCIRRMHTPAHAPLPPLLPPSPSQVEADDLLSGDWDGAACRRALAAALRQLARAQEEAEAAGGDVPQVGAVFVLAVVVVVVGSGGCAEAGCLHLVLLRTDADVAAARSAPRCWTSR